MDSGFSYEKANSVVSSYENWSKLAHDSSPTHRFLMVWPPFGDNILFEGENIKFMGDRLLETRSDDGPVTIIDLGQVQEHVLKGMLEEARLNPSAESKRETT